MATFASTWLGLALLAAAVLKAWRREPSAEALATYGVTRAPAQRAVLWATICLELALAASLIAEAPWAAQAVAVLFVVFAVLSSAAMLRGRGGRPCACFGGGSRLSWATAGRSAALAGSAALIASGWLPGAPTGYDRWLTGGVAFGIAAIAGLALAVLALARELGVLRLQMSSQGALEIADEGPEIGAAQDWAKLVSPGPRAILMLAVFTSDGCPLCRRIAPAVAHVGEDPLLALRIFDELADASAWSLAEVPGSPYAVALDLQGVALAKGTFNSLAQLESILATARTREPGMQIAA